MKMNNFWGDLADASAKKEAPVTTGTLSLCMPLFWISLRKTNANRDCLHVSRSYGKRQARLKPEK